jgi:hypothetical protein
LIAPGRPTGINEAAEGKPLPFQRLFLLFLLFLLFERERLTPNAA